MLFALRLVLSCGLSNFYRCLRLMFPAGFLENFYICFQPPFCKVPQSNWFSLIPPGNPHLFQGVFSRVAATVGHGRGAVVEALYTEICTPASEGSNLASEYIRTILFFCSDIIGVALAPPVTDWLILSSAPHQTNEISARDISSCLALRLALLNADFQSSTPQGHLILLNAQTEKLGTDCPLRPTTRKSQQLPWQWCYLVDLPLQSLAAPSDTPSLTLLTGICISQAVHKSHTHFLGPPLWHSSSPLDRSILLMLILSHWHKGKYIVSWKTPRQPPPRPIVLLSAHPSL